MKNVFIIAILAILAFSSISAANEVNFKFGHEYVALESSVDFGKAHLGVRYSIDYYEHNRHFSSEDQYVGPFARLDVVEIGLVTGNVELAYVMDTSELGRDFWIPGAGLSLAIDGTTDAVVSFLYCDEPDMFGGKKFKIVAGLAIEF